MTACRAVGYVRCQIAHARCMLTHLLEPQESALSRRPWLSSQKMQRNAGKDVTREDAVKRRVSGQPRFSFGLNRATRIWPVSYHCSSTSLHENLSPRSSYASVACTSNMVELLVPESPMLHSGFPSPDLRRSESSSSRYSPPRFLANPSPSTLAPILQEAQVESGSSKGKGNDLRTRVILRHALRWAVDRMDVDLMAWLVGLDGHSVSPLNYPQPS